MSQFSLAEIWKTSLKISKGKYLVYLYIQTQNSHLQLQLSHRNCTPFLLKIPVQVTPVICRDALKLGAFLWLFSPVNKGLNKTFPTR